jgi:ABC-type phosphate transport system substrate-binding protein
MRARLVQPLVVAIILLIANHTIAADSGDAYKVIVHPDNPATSVDSDFLRNAFLKQATNWSDGETVRPVELDVRPVRERFTREILRKSPEQLRNYWNQQIFSGKGVPPPRYSAAEVISYVLKHPGAVGYIPAGVDPGGAKVVTVN